jgi:hypothetical protein
MKDIVNALCWLAVGFLLAVAVSGCGAAPLVFSPEAGPNACIYTGSQVVCETTLDACIVQGYHDTGRHDCTMAGLVLASDGVTSAFKLGDVTGYWHMTGTDIVMQPATGDAPITVPLVDGQ